MMDLLRIEGEAVRDSRKYGVLAIAVPIGLSSKREHWVFRCHAAAAIRLKATFAKIAKGAVGELHLVKTDETAREVEWFLQRFPMEMSDGVRAELYASARRYEARMHAVHSISVQSQFARELKIAKPLRVYQARAVEMILQTGGLLLGDDLGLGKTVSAMGVMAAGKLPALVVCPTHLQRQWVSFIGEFLPELTTHILKQTKAYGLPVVDVIVMSYSKLAAWGDAFAAHGFKLLVFDECQELRRDASQKYTAAAGIRAGVEIAVGLSATPIFNYGGEIFNILEVICPDRLGARAEFMREWCVFRGNDRWALREPDVFGEYMKAEFLMLRRRRQDVGMELPAVERQMVTVPHDADVLAKIDADATELARLVLSGSFTESGQAAREFDMRLRQATGVAKAPFVADFVRMLVENGQKVLLGGWHREVYDIWLHKLGDLNPVLYTGSESPAQKELAKKAFVEGDSQVMIMSLRSGSGVDGLQEVCCSVVVGELDWSPAVHEQFIGRLNRDGQPAGVIAYFLATESGSDPVVSSVLSFKAVQAKGVNDPDKATEFASLQVDGERVKRMAAEWLARKGAAAEVVEL